jgi:hypothetical protein
MDSQKAVDALINLAIAYVVLSIVASAMVEVAFQLLRIRGRILGNTIRGLLGDATQHFYALPTIHGLRQTGWLRRPLREAVGLPFRVSKSMLKAWREPPLQRNQQQAAPDAASAASSVPSERPPWRRMRGTLRAGGDTWRSGHRADADPAVDFIDAATFADALKTLERQRRLPRSLMSANAPFRYKGGEFQIDQARRWFDQAMQAATRQYQRTVQLVLLILGTAMAAAARVNSLDGLQRAFTSSQGLALPSELGFVMTGAAVALGAQYWFDVIGKLLGLRSQVTASGVWGRPARKP